MPADRATLADLARRLEGGETGRDVDAEIAIALGYKIEWKQRNYTMEPFAVITWPDGMREPCLAFTTSLDAIATLVARVLPKAEGWMWIVDSSGRSTIFRTDAVSLKHDNAQATVPDQPAAALALALVRVLMARGDAG